MQQKRPSIVFLTFEYPPAHGGGLSTYMLHATRALADAGAQVTVITPDAGLSTLGGRRVRDLDGVKVISFDPYDHMAFRTMGHWPAMSYAAADQLKRLIEEDGRPDLVEVCDGFALGYYSLLRKLTLEPPFADLKFVVTGHTPTALIDGWEGHDVFRLPRYWTGVMERWCFRAADRVEVPSDFLIGKLQQEFDLSDVAMSCVPNPYRAEATTLPAVSAVERPYACVISRVTKWKGVPAIIAEFARLWEAGETLQLRIYGGDTQDLSSGRSMRETLSERYASYIEDGRLLFGGLVKPEELPAIRAGAEFQIHPSENENFPYTVVEALAQGTPVIVNRNGGQSELVRDGLDGFVYDAATPGAFAEVFARARALGTDARAAMIASGRERVADYCSYERYAATKLATLENLKGVPDTAHFPFVYGKQTILPKPAAADAGAPRLTVVIPYFNMQEFIGETVESIHQSTIPAEIILVNDGSTHPDTAATLAGLEEKYPGIRIISKPNSGVADTRNVGVKAANTEFVALLDADDVVTPDYYRQALALLDRYENVSFVGSWADDYNEKGTIRYWPTFAPEPPSQFIFNMVNAQALIYRRAAYLDAGLHDPALQMYLDDWEATISLLAAGYRGVMIPHPLFRYRIRPNSIFRSGTQRWATNYQMIVDKHAAAFRDYAPQIVKFLNANGPNNLYHNPTYEVHVPGAGAENGGPDGRLMRAARLYYRFMYEEGPRPVAGFLRKVVDVPFSFTYSVARKAARTLRR